MPFGVGVRKPAATRLHAVAARVARRSGSRLAPDEGLQRGRQVKPLMGGSVGQGICDFLSGVARPALDGVEHDDPDRIIVVPVASTCIAGLPDSPHGIITRKASGACGIRAFLPIHSAPNNSNGDKHEHANGGTAADAVRGHHSPKRKPQP